MYVHQWLYDVQKKCNVNCSNVNCPPDSCSPQLSCPTIAHFPPRQLPTMSTAHPFFAHSVICSPFPFLHNDNCSLLIQTTAHIIPTSAHPIIAHPIIAHQTIAHPIIAHLTTAHQTIAHPIIAHPIISHQTIAHPITAFGLINPRMYFGAGQKMVNKWLIARASRSWMKI